MAITDCACNACTFHSVCGDEGRLRCAGYRAEPSPVLGSVPAQRIANFAIEMLAKWEKGAKEHGPVMPADPLDEAMKEAIDLACYSMETFYRLKALKQKVGGLSQERLKELGIGL